MSLGGGADRKQGSYHGREVSDFLISGRALAAYLTCYRIKLRINIVSVNIRRRGLATRTFATRRLRVTTRRPGARATSAAPSRRGRNYIIIRLRRPISRVEPGEIDIGIVWLPQASRNILAPLRIMPHRAARGSWSVDGEKKMPSLRMYRIHESIITKGLWQRIEPRVPMATAAP